MMVQMEINLGTLDFRIKWATAQSEKQKHTMSPHERYVARGNYKAGELASLRVSDDGAVCAEAAAKYG